MADLTSIEEVIREINTENREALNDSDKLVSAFHDLAPELRNEMILLYRLSKCGGTAALLEASSESREEQEKAVNKIVDILVSDYSVEEDRARDICTQFLLGITDKKLTTANKLLYKKNASAQGTMSTSPGNNNGGVFMWIAIAIIALLAACFLALHYWYPTIANSSGRTAYEETEVCAVEHTWAAATCISPKHCTVCGKTEGSALGHYWSAATCTSPRYCTICGATEGNALGHSWTPATCTSPRRCSICGQTEGMALGHSWTAATCTTPRYCTICGQTEGIAHGHSWEAATCTSPRRCTICGQTEGSALGHDWRYADRSGPKTCMRCGITEGSKKTYEQGIECMTLGEARKLFPGISSDIVIPVNVIDVSDYSVTVLETSYMRNSWHVYNDGKSHNFGSTPDEKVQASVCAIYFDIDGETQYLVYWNNCYFWVRETRLS